VPLFLVCQELGRSERRARCFRTTWNGWPGVRGRCPPCRGLPRCSRQRGLPRLSRAPVFRGLCSGRPDHIPGQGWFPRVHPATLPPGVTAVRFSLSVSALAAYSVDTTAIIGLLRQRTDLTHEPEVLDQLLADVYDTAHDDATGPCAFLRLPRCFSRGSKMRRAHDPQTAYYRFERGNVAAEVHGYALDTEDDVLTLFFCIDATAALRSDSPRKRCRHPRTSWTGDSAAWKHSSSWPSPARSKTSMSLNPRTNWPNSSGTPSGTGTGRTDRHHLRHCVGPRGGRGSQGSAAPGNLGPRPAGAHLRRRRRRATVSTLWPSSARRSPAW